MRVLLSRWTSSGTASGSIWNGFISSRVKARPIRTVLVRSHMEPFPCKRGRSQKQKWIYNVEFGEISNIFNDYFINVADNIAKAIPRVSKSLMDL